VTRFFRVGANPERGRIVYEVEQRRETVIEFLSHRLPIGVDEGVMSIATASLWKIVAGRTAGRRRVFRSYRGVPL
jgi:hypothetical protein